MILRVYSNLIDSVILFCDSVVYLCQKYLSSWVLNPNCSVMPSLQRVLDLPSRRGGSPSSYVAQRQDLFLSRGAVSDRQLTLNWEVAGGICPSQSGSGFEYYLLLL